MSSFVFDHPSYLPPWWKEARAAKYGSAGKGRLGVGQRGSACTVMPVFVSITKMRSG